MLYAHTIQKMKSSKNIKYLMENWQSFCTIPLPQMRFIMALYGSYVHPRNVATHSQKIIKYLLVITMPNRYIDRYRQLKSARLKYKQTAANPILIQPNFSSFINITKEETTSSGRTNYNSPSLVPLCERAIISTQGAYLEQYE
jgi:hypothetical protein